VVVLLADIQLAAKNRLDATLLRRIEKMHRTVDIAVIGDRHRALADIGHAIHQLFHVAGAIQK